MYCGALTRHSSWPRAALPAVEPTQGRNNTAVSAVVDIWLPERIKKSFPEKRRSRAQPGRMVGHRTVAHVGGWWPQSCKRNKTGICWEKKIQCFFLTTFWSLSESFSLHILLHSYLSHHIKWCGDEELWSYHGCRTAAAGQVDMASWTAEGRQHCMSSAICKQNNWWLQTL